MLKIDHILGIGHDVPGLPLTYDECVLDCPASTPTNNGQRGGSMARRVEEIKRVRRDIGDDITSGASETRERERDVETDTDRYEEEYYEVGDAEERGVNTASGVLALALLALAIYLIWAALQ